MALKIITAQLLGNESARSRFLREARAAASVRHPNVATVFHLGESGENYFYAMEFVDGETLEALIRRRGRLETELALENRDAGSRLGGLIILDALGESPLPPVSSSPGRFRSEQSSGRATEVR